MIAIAHPLAEELLGLVANEAQPPEGEKPEQDTSWRWVIAVLGVIGLIAWITR